MLLPFEAMWLYLNLVTLVGKTNKNDRITNSRWKNKNKIT